MRILAEPLLCIDDMAGTSRPPLAAAPRQTARADEIRPRDADERRTIAAARSWLPAETIVLVLAAAIALAFAGFYVFRDVHLSGNPIEKAAVKALVERIIAVESDGDPNMKNKRSSATGAAQVLDDTWLEAVRRHRRDLIQGRSDKEVLELRRDAELSREIATRLVEQYAAMLGKRGLPVTPGSLYLIYFAGTAGGVALLSGPDGADAASLMAAADVTGRTTREKLVNANPFLKALTVRDFKTWADRKMAAGNSPRRLLRCRNL
jgi:hypothetical protein